MRERIEALKNLLERRNLEALIISSETNIHYLLGESFLKGSQMILSLQGEDYFLVNKIDYEAARKDLKDIDVALVDLGEHIDNKIVDWISLNGFKNLGYDTMEISSYLKLNNSLKGVSLHDAKELMWSLRKIKDNSELTNIQKAAEITDLGMMKAYEVIEEGVEVRNVVADIEYEMRKAGSDGVAFETIVAPGNSSSLPHGGNVDGEIGRGDMILVDIGATCNGYCADITRTILVGEASSIQEDIYETVKKAHDSALKMIKSGIPAKKVDQVARHYIKIKGYENYFIHNLGHGVGLDIHEPPILGPKSTERLETGYVVTVEPGIYIPGFGGVRIEDTILVLESGGKKLTSSPYIFGI